MSLKKAFLNNLGIKFFALVLAGVTWFYVSETTREGESGTVLERFLSPSIFISKSMPIKPVFVGDIPPGYTLLKDEVIVTPESIVLLGPTAILEKRDFIYTKPIDLREYTKSKTVDIGLEDFSRLMQFKAIKVRVSLSILKIEPENK